MMKLKIKKTIGLQEKIGHEKTLCKSTMFILRGHIVFMVKHWFLVVLVLKNWHVLRHGPCQTFSNAKKAIKATII